MEIKYLDFMKKLNVPKEYVFWSMDTDMDKVIIALKKIKKVGNLLHEERNPNYLILDKKEVKKKLNIPWDNFEAVLKEGTENYNANYNEIITYIHPEKISVLFLNTDLEKKIKDFLRNKKKVVSTRAIITEFRQFDFTEKDIKDCLKSLSRGDIFEPKKGFVQML